MKFCSLPVTGMTVIIKAPRTAYFGPGQFENIPGQQLDFVGGFCEIDENTPEGLQLVKDFLKHSCWKQDRLYYMQQQEIIQLPDGRKASVPGPTLEEAIANAEARIEGKPAPKRGRPAGMTVDMEKPKKQFPAGKTMLESEVPEVKTPMIHEGPVTTSQLAPASKFTKRQ